MSTAFDFTKPAGRRAWIDELLAPMEEAKFDELARGLFAWQVARVPALARLGVAHGVTPKNLRSWRDIPAMPQQVFKLEKLYARGLGKPAAIYETSGTTTGQPGRQLLAATDIYRAVALANAARPRFDGLAHLHFLIPPPLEAPHSSLSAMFGFWAEEFGVKRTSFWVRENAIHFVALRAVLETQCRQGVPIGIAGTAFSFVHAIDAWPELPPLELPPGSWLLETGGFKGRSREVAKPELYAQLARTFSLRDVDIYNEYGMSELSSQAYAHGTNGVHTTPPWARVLVVDPATGREVRAGQRGLVRWIDLANVDSVMALQTLDLAERTDTGSFGLIGRLPRTEPRGCSLGAEDLVQGGVSEIRPAKPGRTGAGPAPATSDRSGGPGYLLPGWRSEAEPQEAKGKTGPPRFLRAARVRATSSPDHHKKGQAATLS